jgi:hypothetical protein
MAGWIIEFTKPNMLKKASFLWYVGFYVESVQACRVYTVHHSKEKCCRQKPKLVNNVSFIC